MKYISKKKEPIALKTYRSTPNATYDDAPKARIRAALIKEQGAICAYCMQRISEDRDVELRKYKTEIEHYRSQSRHPDLALNFKNMLGVCNGNVGQSPHLLHCDKSKSHFDKTYDLMISPLVKNCENKVQFRKNGKITSDDEEVL